MSIEAISWVFKQPILPSSLKFVLVALADCASAEWQCWPSIAHLEKVTCQDRKTIISSVQKLEELGFIKDTGKRVGKTGQIKVYTFKNPNDTKYGTVQDVVSKKTDKLTTVPKTEPLNSTVFPSNSTVFPSKSPENGTRNPYYPLKELRRGKSDFKKRLRKAGFTDEELRSISNDEELFDGDCLILFFPKKFQAERFQQQAGFKIEQIYKKWRPELLAA